MEYIQLSFLLSSEGEENNEKLDDNRQKIKEKNQIISERLKCEFDIMTLPFWGFNFDSIYPRLIEIIPREQIVFDSFVQNILIMS